jgi:serine/threonine protein kinase
MDSTMMEAGTVPIPGQQIGEFKLERLLGLTDTKTLWEARQQRLDRPVLLRVLHRLQSEDETVEAFLSPSRIAASLQHKNIAEVYESGFVDGWHWVAQEHVLGAQLLSSYVESLSRLPSLPVDYFISVSWIFRRALAGVQFAHSHNIVHGNISVDELIWRPGKEPKLLGFGRNVVAGDSDAFSKDIVDVVAALYHAITFRRPDRDNLVSPSLIRPECPSNWDLICREVLGDDDKEFTLDYVLGEIGEWENTNPDRATNSRFRTWLGKFSAT